MSRRLKRPGLTPKKVVIIYLVALFLVSFHELDRLAMWMEGLCLSHGSSPTLLSYCGSIKKAADILGLTRLVSEQRGFLALAQDWPEVGASARRSEDNWMAFGAGFVGRGIKFAAPDLGLDLLEPMRDIPEPTVAPARPISEGMNQGSSFVGQAVTEGRPAACPEAGIGALSGLISRAVRTLEDYQAKDKELTAVLVITPAKPRVALPQGQKLPDKLLEPAKKKEPPLPAQGPKALPALPPQETLPGPLWPLPFLDLAPAAPSQPGPAAEKKETSLPDEWPPPVPVDEASPVPGPTPEVTAKDKPIEVHDPLRRVEAFTPRLTKPAAKNLPPSPAPETVLKNNHPQVQPKNPAATAPPVLNPAALELARLTPPQPAETKKPGRIQPRTVLLTGDSMMLEGFGPALQRTLSKYQGLSVFREGRYSSGLARPDYFDWPSYMNALLDKYKPDLLVVSLGANDPQDILDEKRQRHFCGTPGWNANYAERIRQLLEIPSQKGIMTFWVGMPIMGLDGYNRNIKTINEVAAAECAKLPLCVFVDTWLALADSKNQYTTFIQDSDGRHVRIRAQDKVHLTQAGGEIMVKHFLPLALQYIQLPGQEIGQEKKDQTILVAQHGNVWPGFMSQAAKAPETAQAAARVEFKTFHSQARGKDTSFFAFIPASNPEDRRFPVLYLLHGAWDDYRAWKTRAEGILLELVQEHGLVVITPDGEKFGWYADSALDKTNQIETYFIKELLPYVEKSLPVIPGRRSIAGLSMGGHGAMVLALRHPGLFMSVSSLSGILDITRHSDQWQLARVFGPRTPDNEETWRRHSAFYLSIEQQDYLKKLPLLLSVSAGDRWSLEDNRLLHTKLRELNISHLYRESPGDHDWTYWVSSLPQHLAFHAHILKSAPAP
ncbi:MAG: DUF459 domain-containing protein [Pseudomonadota bacterium]